MTNKKIISLNKAIRTKHGKRKEKKKEREKKKEEKNGGKNRRE